MRPARRIGQILADPEQQNRGDDGELAGDDQKGVPQVAALVERLHLVGGQVALFGGSREFAMYDSPCGALSFGPALDLAGLDSITGCESAPVRSIMGSLRERASRCDDRVQSVRNASDCSGVISNGLRQRTLAQESLSSRRTM